MSWLFRCGVVLLVAGALLSGCGGGGGSDGVIAFTLAAFSVNEDGSVVVPVMLERVGGSGAVSVTVSLTDGTATAGDDYDDTPIVVVWGEGDLAPKQVNVTILNDNTDEQPGETVNLALGSPTGGAGIGLQDAAVLTIIDDDEGGSIFFDEAAYAYGEDGLPSSTTLTLVRVGGTDGEVSVTITSTDGGGPENPANSDLNSQVEPVDFNPLNVVVVFGHGDAAPKPVALSPFIIDDPLPELTESFTLHLGSPTGGVDIGPASTTRIDVTDNDDILRITMPLALQPNAQFGTSVVKLGRHLMIGSPGYPVASGRAYRVNPSVPGVGSGFLPAPGFDSFGTALAHDGNTFAISGDGFVQVYDVDPATLDLTERVDLTSSKDGFGRTLLGLGDGRLLVGAPLADIAGSQAGSVNVHDAQTGGLLQELDGAGAEQLGAAMTRYGAGVAIGAPGEDGVVRIYGGTPLVAGAPLDHPFPESPSPAFGASLLEIPSGVLLMGAPLTDVLANVDSGLVYTWDGIAFDTLPLFGGPNGHFGESLYYYAAADVICVFFPAGGPVDEGTVVFFDATTFALAGGVGCPDPTTNARFGQAMCEYDGMIVVGAPLADIDPGTGLVADCGAVYIIKP